MSKIFRVITFHVNNFRTNDPVPPKVDNKEKKRVSNALYAPYNMFASSDVTSCLAHVTSPRGLNTWFLVKL